MRVWSIAAGIVLIILSDKRFNAAFLGVGIVMLLMSPRLTTPAVLAMPFAIVSDCALRPPAPSPHGLAFLEGRLSHGPSLVSGRVLLGSRHLSNWLGITASRIPTADAGYAYIISNVGLLGFVAFWFWFMSLGGRSRYFYAFRNTSAAYFAAISVRLAPRSSPSRQQRFCGS